MVFYVLFLCELTHGIMDGKMIDQPEHCYELRVGQYATKSECESVIPVLVRRNEADNLKNGWITTGSNSWTSIDGVLHGYFICDRPGTHRAP